MAWISSASNSAIFSPLPLGGMRKSFGAGSAGGVEIAVRILRESPQIGGGGIVDFRRARSERQPAVAADRKIFEIAFLKVRIIGLCPRAGFARETECGSRDEEQ